MNRDITSVQRSLVSRARASSRKLTAALRVLPDFIIIGAQKGGTTFLYRYLVQHPAVLPASKKEVRYFDIGFHRGNGWYRAHFPLQAHIDRKGSSPGARVITGESSPDYILHPLAAEHAHKTVPDAKIIAILRNPVDRAYSHYRHAVRDGKETLQFEEAIACEESRIEGEVERVLADGRYNPRSLSRYSYLCRGNYASQLERWMAVFPRDQILVLQAERLFDAPQTVFQQVLRFLGLEPWHPESMGVFNEGSYPPLSPDVRTRLVEYFQEHNQRLYELLGTRFDWDP